MPTWSLGNEKVPITKDSGFNCVLAQRAIDAAQNDVIEMIRLPKGAIIVNGWLKVSGAAGAGVTVDVGITTTDADLLIDGADINGTLFHKFSAVAGFGYTMTAQDTIDLLLLGAEVNSITYTLCVIYTMDDMI